MWATTRSGAIPIRAAALQKLQGDLNACQVHAHNADHELATAIGAAVGEVPLDAVGSAPGAAPPAQGPPNPAPGRGTPRDVAGHAVACMAPRTLGQVVSPRRARRLRRAPSRAVPRRRARRFPRRWGQAQDVAETCCCPLVPRTLGPEVPRRKAPRLLQALGASRDVAGHAVARRGPAASAEPRGRGELQGYGPSKQ